MKRPLILMFLLLGSISVVAHAQAPIDWKSVEAETLQHFRALVQIDTSNPPGNETKAVNYIKQVLEKEGIVVQVFASTRIVPISSLVSRATARRSQSS